MHIDHINICAPRELLEKVRDFYCFVLDLTEGYRPDFSSGGFWLYAGDKAIIHLSENSNRSRSEKQGFFDHYALRTTKLPAIIQKLNELGVEYRSVQSPEIGLSQVFFRDPSDTGVEVNALIESQ